MYLVCLCLCSCGGLMCRLDDRIVNRVGSKTKHQFHGGENGNWLTLHVLRSVTHNSRIHSHWHASHGRCNAKALTHAWAKRRKPSVDVTVDSDGYATYVWHCRCTVQAATRATRCSIWNAVNAQIYIIYIYMANHDFEYRFFATTLAFSFEWNSNKSVASSSPLAKINKQRNWRLANGVK